MDPKRLDIGKKIRSLRLSRALTQTELCGGSITRNMLSLIENGNATPSLPTLVYLAERLGVPVGYFFAASEEEISEFTKMSRIGEIRRFYQSGDFAACLSACKDIPRPDDEIRRILAECSLALAASACAEYTLSSASVHLTAAQDVLSGCTYASDSLTSTIQFLSHLIRCANQSRLPRELLDTSRYPASRIPTEFFVYIRALSFIDGDRVSDAAALRQSGLIINPTYQDVLAAKEMMRQERHAEAFALLQKVLVSRKPGFFTAFRVMDALESCASTLGDFKNAYQYSTEKIKLLEQFAK